MHAGIKLLADTPGDGPLVERKHIYRIRLKMWLNKGEPIRWRSPWGPVDSARLEDEGETLITDVRLSRSNVIGGLFYGLEGMRVGGTRRLKISPHMAYGDKGIPDIVPPGAVLIAEIALLGERA